MLINHSDIDLYLFDLDGTILDTAKEFHVSLNFLLQQKKLIEKEFKSDNYNITRFKGLGEMPADQLKETTMDQNKRNLILINSEKAKKDMKNTESLFETLMGKQAELRFKFIQNNANFIKNLDV